MLKTKAKSYFILTIITGLIAGCASTVHHYTPQKSAGWKKEFLTDVYKYQCGDLAISVMPIQMKPLDGEFPYLPLNIEHPKGVQQKCALAFVWLEDTNSGQHMDPIREQTGHYTDGMATYCHYYFDIPEKQDGRYKLHISDQFLGCPINPISLVYRKTYLTCPPVQ